MNNAKQIKVSELKLHPEVARIPFGSAGEFQELKADIAQKGIENALEVNSSGVILDGRRRWTAAKELELESVPCLIVAPEDETDFLFRRALLRRNLTDYARIELLKNHREHLAARGRKNQKENNQPEVLYQNSDKAVINTNKQLGEIAGVSHDTVGRWSFLDKNAPEPLKEQLINGEVSINAAYEEVKQQEEAQNKRDKQAHFAPIQLPPIEAKGSVLDSLILADVLDGLALIKTQDVQVHLTFTSPPYPLKDIFYQNHSFNEQFPNGYTDYLPWLRQVMQGVYDITAHGGRICINIDPPNAREQNDTEAPVHNLYCDLSNIMREIGWNFYTEICWFKQNTIGARPNWGTYNSCRSPRVRRTHEYLLCFCKGSSLLDGEQSKCDLLEKEFKDWTISQWYIPPVSRIKDIEHPDYTPCPFPEELALRIIKLFCYQEQVVLDPFCGSGTVPFVATALNRRFIGIDNAPKYVASAQNRIDKLSGKCYGDKVKLLTRWKPPVNQRVDGWGKRKN